MVSLEPVLEADLKVASFASAAVRKGQNLLASLNWARGLLLLGGVAGAGPHVPLQQNLLVVMGSGFDGGGTGLANEDLSAVVVGFGTFVGLVRTVLQTKHLFSYKNKRIKYELKKKKKEQNFETNLRIILSLDWIYLVTTIALKRKEI